jgi:hypothetical protein
MQMKAATGRRKPGNRHLDFDGCFSSEDRDR